MAAGLPEDFWEEEDQRNQELDALVSENSLGQFADTVDMADGGDADGDQPETESQDIDVDADEDADMDPPSETEDDDEEDETDEDEE